MTRVVLDASVAVAWFVPEDEDITRAAAEILDRIVEGELSAVVPELFWFELLAVLVRRLPGEGTSSHAVRQLTDLGFERVALDPDLAEEAERLARERRLTGYDAVYAALALTTGATWWTLDRSAHDRISDLSISRLITA